MKRRYVALFSALVVAITGCPGPEPRPDVTDGGNPGPLVALEGTWSGTVENPSSRLGRIKIIVDSGGHMSITTAEGSMTGTAVHVQGNLYGYELSDGTSGGFMVDDSGRHAGFVDRQFYFGVVEKGATNLPRYDALDLVGSWSGSTVELSGPELELVRTYSSSATVSSAYAFVGSNAAHGVFAGSFEDYSADYGRFRGRASLPDDSLMNVAIFLSADKSFAAGYACRAYGRFPDECTFTGWHK